MPLSRSAATALARTILAGAQLLLLGACEPPAFDYRTEYAIPVHGETVALPLHPGSGGDPVAGSEAGRFAVFAADFVERGHGPLTVAARESKGAGDAAEIAALKAVRERLIGAGVPASAVRLVLTADGEPGVVTLSYQRYDVALPVCNDWSAAPSFDPYNGVYPNYGCAMQHNLGAMIADPVDLVGMREVSATDAENSNRVLQKYLTGQPTAATPNPLQQSGAAGIVGVGH